MHELSVAQSLMSLVREHVPAADAPRVRAVRVRMGTLRGLAADSLRFCFEALAANQGIPNARLDIEPVPARASCADCSHRFQLYEPAFVCPDCGGTRLEATGGDELELHEIELEEEADTEVR